MICQIERCSASAAWPPRELHSYHANRTRTRAHPHSRETEFGVDFCHSSRGALSRAQGREECLAPYRAAEMIVPELFARTTMYTTQGELADFYVVPVFTECFLLTRLNKGIDFAR